MYAHKGACFLVWGVVGPMPAGKAHTGPHKGGQRVIYPSEHRLGNGPGSASARRRHMGTGGVTPVSARNVHPRYACGSLTAPGGEGFGPADGGAFSE